MSEDSAVEVDHVAKTFAGRRVAVLEDVSFRVRPGELTVLVGPSGSGKTTTLNLIGALDRTDRGRINVFGHDVTGRRHLDRYRREVVGTIFQLHNLLAHLDVRQNVEVVMLGAHAHRKQRQARAGALLAALALTEHADDRPPELSGGERQRVAVARAFANDPKLVLADEPTGSLDDTSAALVVTLLREHCTAGGAVLAVSHDPRLTTVADRVLRVDHATITEVGQTSFAIA